jgi:AcrR family transcriptional regulator
MTRTLATDRKAEIIERLVDYLASHGPADLSLRPMAAAVGTSARLLIFHFGSKERLLLQVLREIERGLQVSLARLLKEPARARGVAPLRAFWNWALKEENRRRLRLIYEIHMLAARETGVFSKSAKQGPRKSLEMVTAALPPPFHTAPAATLFCAVFDGLFLELIVTGDAKRTTRALDLFVQMARGVLAPRSITALSPGRDRIVIGATRKLAVEADNSRESNDDDAGSGSGIGKARRTRIA